VIEDILAYAAGKPNHVLNPAAMAAAEKDS